MSKQARAWRFSGVLTAPFEQVTQLLQPHRFAAAVWWVDGHNTIMSGYIEGTHALRKNRVIRTACLEKDTACAWPTEGLSLSRSQRLLALLDEAREQSSDKHTWWFSAGTGLLTENNKRLVDVVEDNKARLRDSDVITFGRNNAVGELVRWLTSSDATSWRLVNGRVEYVDANGSLVRSSKKDICAWLCEQLYEACVPIMQRLYNENMPACIPESGHDAQQRARIEHIEHAVSRFDGLIMHPQRWSSTVLRTGINPSP